MNLNIKRQVRDWALLRKVEEKLPIIISHAILVMRAYMISCNGKSEEGRFLGCYLLIICWLVYMTVIYLIYLNDLYISRVTLGNGSVCSWDQ